jgi:CRP-like cAMP-binding protein
MIERHLAKLRARHSVSPAEEEAIRGLVADTRRYEPDRVIVRAGESLDFSTLLLEGLLCRHKDLRSGERQISELHVAGDFADLHSFTLKRLDHEVSTLTECAVGIVPHERLSALFAEHRRLGLIYWFSTNLDAAIHREWTVSLGRRSTPSRMAHLFCELHVRLGLVGLARDLAFALPLTQLELAECLGVTSVHVNRVLRELRERGLVDFRGGQVTIQDLPGLEQAAEFDPSYLYLDAPEF